MLDFNVFVELSANKWSAAGSALAIAGFTRAVSAIASAVNGGSARAGGLAEGFVGGVSTAVQQSQAPRALASCSTT